MSTAKKVRDLGFVWSPYLVSFESPDGEFSFTIHAISHEHAQLQLQAIKDSARVLGRIDSTQEG